jgi:phosphoenolpyruvate-protein phosphotransferase (PTS system enzyme I)
VERLTGIGVSEGVAVGPALVAIQRTQVIRFPIAPERVGRELAALDRARERSHEQLQQIRTRMAALRGADLAAIFDAQLLILEDQMLIGRAAELVREERVNAEWAVQSAMDELGKVFNDLADPYLRERKGDLHDVAGRLRMNLRDEKGSARDLLEDLETPCVLIADELTPSVVAQLDWTRIRGFATDAGSRTYHTAILARSLGVPAVVGLHAVSRHVPPRAWVIVDGATGEVIINPPPAMRQEAEARATLARPRVVTTTVLGPVETSDGVRITLEANVERADDAPIAVAAGAEGIGLYRSEFMIAGAPPDLVDEDEQYRVYRQLVEGMGGRPVTVRTFDVDERQIARPLVDAALDGRWFPDQDRPAGHGGLRGIRFGLANPPILKRQIRALLRASQHGPIRVLFPFVSSLQEVLAARTIMADVRAELAGAGIETADVPVGIMIEVPSAAFTASILARAVDFFTIGTNDLIQYTLAVDRTDERVSDRYEPLHPAVLRLIRHVRRGAMRQGIPVSVCGEMASDPLLLRLLIGCGLTQFSMTPGAMPVARRVIRETDAGRMARLAARVMTLGTVEEIEQALLEAFGKSKKQETTWRTT